MVSIESERLFIGPLGEVKPPEAIIGGREAKPTLCAFGICLDSDAKASFSQPVAALGVVEFAVCYRLILGTLVGRRRQGARDQIRLSQFLAGLVPNRSLG